MDEKFDIQGYMTRGVENIVAESLKATLKDPRESAFMLKFASAAQLKTGIAHLREEYPETVFVSFPGDEKSSGGCIAAGRGFFHINSHGGAEPCPFSPYSDINVRDTSLRDALKSPLFTALREGGLLSDDHVGGCVLYEKRDAVETLLAERSEL